MAFRFCKVKRSATQVAGAMWGGTGRTFNRAADGAGDHQQWASQTRGNPSQELAARYAASAGLVAPAPTAATPPAAVPPGVAFAPSPHGQMEPPWLAEGFFCGALWASRLFGDAGDVTRASRLSHASRPVSTLSTSD